VRGIHDEIGLLTVCLRKPVVWQRSRNRNQNPADDLDGVDFEALHINLTRP
jgi:hypothetical protein